MTEFLVRYTHIEEKTYEQWIEAMSEEEALQKIDEEANFEILADVRGLDLRDFEVIDKK